MEATIPEKPRLTELSHGSGCGCKIGSENLHRILASLKQSGPGDGVLVDLATSDDASVIDLGNGTALVSTTDFFMPIVDDPMDFGRIAAANAISDVFAMGGKPITALAILGWPIDRLGAEAASQVLEGAQEICKEVGIGLSGGHSIDAREPFFGLAVSGIVSTDSIVRNNTPNVGDFLFLTKPIGTGIIATAIKRGVAQKEDILNAVAIMSKTNKVGAQLASEGLVSAMTDLTGFGLLGHLGEMIGDKHELSVELDTASIPVFDRDRLKSYMDQAMLPDNTMRNFRAYHGICSPMSGDQLKLFCDPQTSGGLLLAVSDVNKEKVKAILTQEELYSSPIGRFVRKESDAPKIHW